MLAACWEKVKQRYDVAFIGAASAIVFGLLFIFFTMVVSEWMFPGPYNAPDENTSEASSVDVSNGGEDGAAETAAKKVGDETNKSENTGSENDKGSIDTDLAKDESSDDTDSGIENNGE